MGVTPLYQHATQEADRKIADALEQFVDDHTERIHADTDVPNRYPTSSTGRLPSAEIWGREGSG